MKQVILLSAVSSVNDVTTQAFDLNDLTTFAIAVNFTGSNVVGSLKLKASVDNTTFFDVTNSTQAVTASTDHIWDVVRAGYRFIAVDWDYTSGTGNIEIKLVVKENVVRFP